MARRTRKFDFDGDDINFAEFTDVYLERDGKKRKLREEKKRVPLRFTVGKSVSRVQAEGETSPDDLDDIAGEGAFFSGGINSYQQRRSRSSSAWESNRTAVLETFMKGEAMSVSACSICSQPTASYRCRACGPFFYFCTTCLFGVHEHQHHFHVPEKWKVLFKKRSEKQ